MNPQDKHRRQIAWLQNRLEERPGDIEFIIELAEAWFQDGYYFSAGGDSFRQALATLEKVPPEAIEERSRVLNLMANACYGLEDLDTAEQHYRESLEYHPNNALAHVGLGNLFRAKGMEARALESFRTATHLDPELWQARYNLGSALHGVCRRAEFRGVDEAIDEAIYQLVSCLALQPFPAFLPHIYRDLGELLLHARRYRQARRFFRKLLEHPEHGTPAHYYLGLAAYSLGKFKTSIQHYRLFLRTEPDSVLALSKLALSYLELGEYERARDACNRALSLSSENLLARFTLGCVARDEGNLEEAIALFGDLLQHQADYLPAYVEWVRARHQAGHDAGLRATLLEEVERFESSEGQDGGRGWGRGQRGQHRQHIEVLVSLFRELGQYGFESLTAALARTGDESLRFQLWEVLYQMARGAQVGRVEAILEDPAQHLSPKLGRTILLLGPLVAEEFISDALAIDRHQARDSSALLGLSPEQAEDDLRQFQAYLLLALATRATTDAEELLLEHLDSEDELLRSSAAIALIFYGSERAEGMLRKEAERASGPERDTLEELLRIGHGVQDTRRKVIDLATVSERRPRTPRAARAPSSDALPIMNCSVCGRTEEEVSNFVAGNRTLVCNHCISYIDASRDRLRAQDHPDLGCKLCQSTVFERDEMYRMDWLVVCNSCVDVSLRRQRREEVERLMRGRL